MIGDNPNDQPGTENELITANMPTVDGTFSMDFEFFQTHEVAGGEEYPTEEENPTVTPEGFDAKVLRLQR